MIIADREAFCDEARRFVLRCACEDCVYFVQSDGRCAHGYPNEAHRTATLLLRAAEPRASEMNDVAAAFCKEFEIR